MQLEIKLCFEAFWNSPVASNNSKKILFEIFEILSLIFVKYNLVKYEKLGGKEQVPSVTGPTVGS